MFAIPELLCPYCNQKLQSYTAPHFTSACCNRLVAVNEITDYRISLSVMGDRHKKQLGLEGDNSRVPGTPKFEGSRPNSKWTWVFWDMGFHYVRLIPKTISVDSTREWGLAFATTFTSEVEAHSFADSVDAYMDAIEKGILQKAQEVENAMLDDMVKKFHPNGKSKNEN